jgi:hypothetical protein
LPAYLSVLPRFASKLEISQIFESFGKMMNDGFNEPAHCDVDGYYVYGKTVHTEFRGNTVWNKHVWAIARRP